MAGESRTQDNVNKSRTVLDIPGWLEPIQKQEEVDECAQEYREMDEEPLVKHLANAIDNVKLFLENHGSHARSAQLESL